MIIVTVKIFSSSILSLTFFLQYFDVNPSSVDLFCLYDDYMRVDNILDDDDDDNNNNEMDKSL
ncbi:unnamed protein product [Trichobilharzia regenti]|nr:unnamed protein product [Trichobilharzia regenti]